MTNAIEVQKLTKKFQPGRGLLETLGIQPSLPSIKVLDQVSLEVPAGETFVLLGPNGVGKTTLIKTLCQLVLPDQGEAKVFGFDISRDSKKAKALVNLVVSEERSFYWRLTGRQNLEFFARLYGLSVQETKKKIIQIAERLNLEHLDKRFQEYSSGMRQRLALARGLLYDAKLLFLDEPTKSLDPKAREQFQNLLQEISKAHPDRTLFLTTHSFTEAEALGKRIAIMDQGKICVCGALEDLGRQAQMPGASLAEIYKETIRHATDSREEIITPIS